MPAANPNRKSIARQRRRLGEAIEALTALEFGPKQRNETAAYTLLALLDLRPDAGWANAQAPLRGLKGINVFIASAYGRQYAENTRETIRDDAVKFFVEEGLLLRNPDDPKRPTNSRKTVYQIEPTALALFHTFGTGEWTPALARYLASRETLKHEIARKRDLARVPVTLPDGSQVALSPGGQDPLIKTIIERFCPAFAPGGVVLYIGDTENKFVHLETAGLGCGRKQLPDEYISGLFRIDPKTVRRGWMELEQTGDPTPGRVRKKRGGPPSGDGAAAATGRPLPAASRRVHGG